jgi:hypothetical protein
MIAYKLFRISSLRLSANTQEGNFHYMRKSARKVSLYGVRKFNVMEFGALLNC